jgi:hypothetical protein
MTLTVKSITASSHYQSAKYGPDGLGPEQLLLQQPKFGGWLCALNAWQESWLEFTFSQPCVPRSLCIRNGFIEPEENRERDDFYYHLRARNIELSTERESHRLELADQKEPQVVALPFSQPTHSLRLTIHSVWRDAPDGAIKSHDLVGLGRIDWSA